MSLEAIASIAALETSVAGCRVDRVEMLRYLGYAGQDMDDALDARVDAAIADCEREARPAFTYRSFPIEAAADGVHLAGSPIVLDGSDIAAHLSGAVAATVLACTLGLANEQSWARRKAADALDALLYGTAGSSLVESVANRAEARIVADAAICGLHTNWRYGPGYGDLPLSLQPQIVRVLDADRSLGLTATDTDLLIPSKSITAIIGLFEAGEGLGSGVKSNCDACVCAESCALRASGTPCWGH